MGRVGPGASAHTDTCWPHGPSRRKWEKGRHILVKYDSKHVSGHAPPLIQLGPRPQLGQVTGAAVALPAPGRSRCCTCLPLVRTLCLGEPRPAPRRRGAGRGTGPGACPGVRRVRSAGLAQHLVSMGLDKFPAYIIAPQHLLKVDKRWQPTSRRSYLRSSSLPLAGVAQRRFNGVFSLLHERWATHVLPPQHGAWHWLIQSSYHSFLQCTSNDWNPNTSFHVHQCLKVHTNTVLPPQAP